MVAIPDTQFEINDHPEMWVSIYNWIVENAETMNIKAVIGLGDIVNLYYEDWSPAVDGWDAIRAAGLPVMPVIGNHDYNVQATRDATAFLANFGPSYFSEDTCYGGCYNGSTESYYINVTVGAIDYLIIALEYFPRDAHLAWAQGIIDANPTKTVIIVTHGYLDGAGDRIHPTSIVNEGNSGQELWDKFLKLNDIYMVLCGHLTQSSLRIDANEDETDIIQILTDYQTSITNYGDGVIRLIVFRDNGDIDLIPIKTSTGKIFNASHAYRV